MASKTSGGGTGIFIFSSLLAALVFLVTTLGSVIGTWVGGYEIFRNLFAAPVA